MTKNPSIDLLKGLLILLVMGGHAMELTHQQHVLLWIGSGFRMPLMIGISGYLLNVTRTRSMPMGEMFSRYGRRMLLPWAVAMLVYWLASGGLLSWQTPLDLLRPPPAAAAHGGESTPLRLKRSSGRGLHVSGLTQLHLSDASAFEEGISLALAEQARLAASRKHAPRSPGDKTAAVGDKGADDDAEKLAEHLVIRS